MTYFALAYYIFTPIEMPKREIKRHKKFFEERDTTGRIYISEEGINGQMSGAHQDALDYIAWLRSDPRFEKVRFKIHEEKKNLFPRMAVKYREQIVALNEKVDIEETGEHVSPETWKEMLESDEDYLLLDVRNDYEWEIGHFEGATLPPLKQFRDFPKYADQLKETHDPKKTKVMMYCTGGIRCELYSALMKKRGFDTVYQLDGGVIDYGLKQGNKHWKGKLFVFDDRMAIPIDGKENEPISNCCFCAQPSDIYYNCANMDCNELFLSCQECIEKHVGCCSSSCETAPRRRPFKREDGNRPFRKKHLLEDATSAHSSPP